MNKLKIIGPLILIALVGTLWLWFNPAATTSDQAALSGSTKTEKGEIDREPDGAEKGDGRGGAQGARKAEAQTGAAEVASGKSASGRPESAKPSSGQATSGKPASGKPSSAQTSSGKPASGKPASGRPASGKPSSGKPSSGRPGGWSGRPRSTLVATEPSSEATINDRLSAVGSGAAVSSVSVVPLSAGTLIEVLVSSGQQVEQGDVLARLDDEEQVLARDRAARTAQNTITNEERLAKLFRSRTASAADLDSAKALRADAELALREAELKLQRRKITAPISGVVGLISVDTGNYVTGQTELVTIDDRSTIIVEFWIPERFANKVVIGQAIEATALANPGKVYKGVISGIDSRIETDSRTLPVEAKLDNSSDSLRPGMSFELQLAFAGQTFASVNPLAVQWDSKGSYLWKVVDDKALRQPVKIIQRNPKSVLVDGDIAVDDQIVVEGLLSLRPGATVRVQGAGS